MSFSLSVTLARRALHHGGGNKKQEQEGRGFATPFAFFAFAIALCRRRG
jgi:hypothetical protein